ncbi:MAG: hypothetical protein RIR79_1517 [Pseudomonadota bacterium]|jgi:uncharacterized protein YacL
MSAQNDESQSIVFGTVGLVLTLVIALLIGIGLHSKSKHQAAAKAAVTLAAPAAIMPAATITTLAVESSASGVAKDVNGK